MLIGGRSTRFGRDKASYPLAGKPMALHVAAAMRTVLPRVTLVGKARQAIETDLPVIPDAVKGAGPLAGIVAALHHLREPWCVISACDMPLASDRQIASLLRAAALCRGEAVIPRTPDGHLQPLFAAYRKTARKPLAEALSRGTRKVLAALDSVAWSELEFSDLTAFTNVNSRADLHALP